MVSNSVKSQLTEELKEDIWRACRKIPFTIRVINGIPSQRERANKLFQQAFEFLQKAIFAAGQHCANSVMWPPHIAPSMDTVCHAWRMAPRPRVVKPLSNQWAMHSHFWQSWHVCGCTCCGLPRGDPDFEERADPESEADVALAAFDGTLHEARWRTTLDIRPRSFNRLGEHYQQSGLIERAVKGLIEEFEGLWRC